LIARCRAEYLKIPEPLAALRRATGLAALQNFICILSLLNAVLSLKHAEVCRGRRRLFNYGIGIHLIAGHPAPRPSQINPKADHLSFQVRC